MTTKKGFTIVEIMLSLVFISILLIAIASVTIQVNNIYQKGLTLRTINSVGQEIIDEFARATNNAPAKKIECLSGTDTKYNCVYHQESAIINVNGAPTKVPVHGAFCTGRYSYVWNTGYAINKDNKYSSSNNKANLEYHKKDGAVITKSDFRMLRVRDDEKELCAKYNPDSRTYTVETGDNNDPLEMFENSDDHAVFYDLTIFKPVQHHLTLHTFYSGTFILGTVDGDVDITAIGDYCTNTSQPDNLATDFNYCMINKFNFATRAAGDLTNAEKAEYQKENI